MSGKSVTYLASRNMISGRTEGDEVTIDLDGKLAMRNGLRRQPRVEQRIQRSIANRAQITFSHLRFNWRFTTIPMANDDSNAKLFREFLESSAGTTVTFTPGTEYDTDSPIASINGIVESWSETPVPVGTGFYYRFSFTIGTVA